MENSVWLWKLVSLGMFYNAKSAIDIRVKLIIAIRTFVKDNILLERKTAKIILGKN